MRVFFLLYDPDDVKIKSRLKIQAAFYYFIHIGSRFTTNRCF
jgi:hypothetical protein